MEDLISRQAVLDAMYELCDTGETLKENPWRDNPHIDAITDAIEDLPPVTQKSGKWISEKVDGEDWKGCKRQYYQPISCSKCHSPNHYKSTYCPNCGCRMVEPQERSDKE